LRRLWSLPGRRETQQKRPDRLQTGPAAATDPRLTEQIDNKNCSDTPICRQCRRRGKGCSGSRSFGGGSYVRAAHGLNRALLPLWRARPVTIECLAAQISRARSWQGLGPLHLHGQRIVKLYLLAVVESRCGNYAQVLPRDRKLGGRVQLLQPCVHDSNGLLPKGFGLAQIER
jgi:hypothetical protein